MSKDVAPAGSTGLIVPHGTAGRASVEGYDPAVHDQFFNKLSGELSDKGFITTRLEDVVLRTLRREGVLA